MTRLASQLLLLADENRLTHMGRHFRRGSDNLTVRDMLIIFLVVVCVAGVTWILSRILYGAQRRIRNSPRALFRELCKAHGLDGASRKLLADLAKSHALPHAAQLFVEPSRFETAQVAAELQPRESEIRALREKLFQTSV